MSSRVLITISLIISIMPFYQKKILVYAVHSISLLFFNLEVSPIFLSLSMYWQYQRAVDQLSCSTSSTLVCLMFPGDSIQGLGLVQEDHRSVAVSFSPIPERDA